MKPFEYFSVPTYCQSCKSANKFETQQSSPFTNTIDWQVAKIQEIQSQVKDVLLVESNFFYHKTSYNLWVFNLLLQSISGTIPRSVEIELQGDLVGTACPGDVLSVTGIVQVSQIHQRLVE